MNGFRERLEDMGQPVPDERYEDVLLQALPAESAQPATRGGIFTLQIFGAR